MCRRFLFAHVRENILEELLLICALDNCLHVTDVPPSFFFRHLADWFENRAQCLTAAAFSRTHDF